MHWRCAPPCRACTRAVPGDHHTRPPRRRVFLLGRTPFVLLPYCSPIRPSPIPGRRRNLSPFPHLNSELPPHRVLPQIDDDVYPSGSLIQLCHRVAINAAPGRRNRRGELGVRDSRRSPERRRAVHADHIASVSCIRSDTPQIVGVGRGFTRRYGGADPMYIVLHGGHASSRPRGRCPTDNRCPPPFTARYPATGLGHPWVAMTPVQPQRRLRS